MGDGEGVLSRLAGNSSTLFLAAGVFLVVFAANTGARVFADAGASAIHSVLGPAGFFLGIVGLFGLYPTVSKTTPRLARIAAVVAVIPLVDWFVIASLGLGGAAGLTSGSTAVLPGAAFAVVFPTTVLAYFLFGAASLRSTAYTRTVGLLLLLPGGVFVALLVGVALRTAGSAAERPSQAADSTP